MPASDAFLSRAPRAPAPDGTRRPRSRVAFPELAIVVLLLIVMLSAGAVAGTLSAVEGASNRAEMSARLARQYDALGADLVQLELLRPDVLLGDPAAVTDLPLVSARLSSDADLLLGAAGRGSSSDADDALFGSRVRQYRALDATWLTGRRPAGHDEHLHQAATALRSSLNVETEQHQRNATVAEDQRRDLLSRLQRGTGPGLVVLLASAAVAGLAASRRRRQLQTAVSTAEWNSVHDPLTGLANRLALSRAIESRGAQSNVTLLWLDLDDFKVVNDAAGHAYGDLVLEAVADRLVAVVRPDDLVARIGGDEFVVLCSGFTTTAGAMECAARVVAALRRPLPLAAGARSVTASIGVAIDSGGDAGRLLVAADAAMYQAKRLGGGGVALFDETLRAAWAERSEVALALKGAAARGELRLHYQPLVDLRSGSVRGVEALVRWQHPTRGLLGPDAFIEIAEETGTIIDLGEWVLTEACKTLAAWELDSPAGHDLRVSVNVSAKQLTEGRTVGSITRALRSAGANPALLTVEVTESAVMVDVTTATQTLKDIRALGVHLAIDDFGTGYSSLSYLKQFPIHELKLDKSFVGGVGTRAEDSAIVAAVVSLAGAVGLKVVAEGIETLRQSTVLRTLGCDYGQGFLWHRPAPRDVLEAWMQARPPARGNPNIIPSRPPAGSRTVTHTQR